MYIYSWYVLHYVHLLLVRITLYTLEQILLHYSVKFSALYHKLLQREFYTTKVYSKPECVYKVSFLLDLLFKFIKEKIYAIVQISECNSKTFYMQYAIKRCFVKRIYFSCLCNYQCKQGEKLYSEQCVCEKNWYLNFLEVTRDQKFNAIMFHSNPYHWKLQQLTAFIILL